jgi:hypothetical protein
LPDQDLFNANKREEGALAYERRLNQETAKEIAAREKTRAQMVEIKSKIEKAIKQTHPQNMPNFRFIGQEGDEVTAELLPNGGLISKQAFEAMQEEDLNLDMQKSIAELAKELLSAVEDLSHLVDDEDSKVWLRICKIINDNLTILASIFRINLSLTLDPVENATAIKTELLGLEKGYINSKIKNNKREIVRIIRNLKVANGSFEQNIEEETDRFRGFIMNT